MENTINTHADANFLAKVFDMDVGGLELVGLVNDKIEDLVARDGIEGLANFRNSLRVALLSNPDVFIMRFFRWIEATHEGLVGRVWDEKKADLFAIFIIFLPELGEETVRSLTSDQKLIRIAALALLERDDEVFTHFWYAKDTFSKRNSLFKIPSVKIW